MSARQPIEDDEPEELLCIGCNGSGEGHYDGSSCSSCGGSGVESQEPDEDDFIEPDEPEECHRYYDGT
jgi:DnaJ-class molecular chaperone